MRTINVGRKFETHRSASAYGRIKLSPDTLKLIREKQLPKGDLIEATKLTGIFGAKKTGEILPFCHPINIDFIEVKVQLGDSIVEVFSEVSGVARTGYEMEALTAVATSLLNIYDMCKGVDEGMVIEEIRLTSKSGGKSDWKGDLKGIRVSVFATDRSLKGKAEDYLRELDAELSEEGEVVINIGEEVNFHEELSSLESVIALYDFRNNPPLIGEEIKVGKDAQGKLIVYIPPREEKLSLLFQTFGGLLRSLL